MKFLCEIQISLLELTDKPPERGMTKSLPDNCSTPGKFLIGYIQQESMGGEGSLIWRSMGTASKSKHPFGIFDRAPIHYHKLSFRVFSFERIFFSGNTCQARHPGLAP